MHFIHIHQACKVAGLGSASDTRRDGSFEYYMSEPIVDDDSKAFGALLSALAYYAKEE